MQVDGLQLSSGGRGVNNGLWGIWLKNGADNLIKNYNAGSRLIRDIAVQGLQPLTVIVNSECSGFALHAGFRYRNADACVLWVV